jgi:phosphoserine phosphatase RsbU/P
MIAGIRARLLAIIALATLAPLAIAILAIQTIGYHHLVKERGAAFQAGAAHLAGSIRLLARAELSQLQEYLTHDLLLSFSQEANRGLEGISKEELQRQIQDWEARWPTLQSNAPELIKLLQNPLARDLRAFQQRHLLCAEILVTDRAGRLIASTGKTSDYWQADEGWFHQAVLLRPGEMWLEGLHFDESSATYALDVSLAVRTPDGQVTGALKASLNASPLFSSVSPVLRDSHLKRDIVGEDGAVLLRLHEPDFRPGAEHLDARALTQLRARSEGWMVRPLFNENKSLAGFAALLIDPARDKPGGTSLAPMFVVVHEPSSVALVSLRKQVTLLTFSGAVLVLVFSAAGLWLATSRIIAPVALLRTAADAVAATVQPAANSSEGRLAKAASDQLARLSDISTRDELETLARDFQVMGRRVLRYQQQLEEDIAAKTATIQRDLDMARDFQTALMPSSYPIVPEGECPAQIGLSFQHMYRPASTVGGDFFDVLKLSRHQAGIFVADVMGHGARSALITAILRTLLQTYAKQAREPAALLSMVNRQFHELTERTQQTVFVTALYMVVDTLRGSLTCSSAGHPSPLIANGATGSVAPLFTRLKGNPALGLFARATYASQSHALRAGDLLLLYTDGVVETTNPAGEEFGLEGLTKFVRANLGDTNGELINLINAELTKFNGSGQFEDDICLVTVEILKRQSGPELNRSTVTKARRVGI